MTANIYKTLKKAERRMSVATKKRNKREVVRRVRRVLNRSLDVLLGVSGKRLHTHNYGTGVNAKAVNERNENGPDQGRDD